MDREIAAAMDYEITSEEVKSKLDAAEVFTLLDVREPWEFATAKIDGAKLMPMVRGGIDAWSRRVDGKVPTY